MQMKAVLVLSFLTVAQAIKPGFVSPTEMTFAEAETFCQQKGGRLAQPTSVRDTYFEAGEPVYAFYWFDAYVMPSGGFFWTNGTAISWNNWIGGTDKIPSLPDKRFMSMDSSTHKWYYAGSATTKHKALCEPIDFAGVLDRLTRAEEKTQETNDMILGKLRDLERSIQLLQAGRHIVGPIPEYKRIASQAAREAHRNATSQH